MYSPTLKDKYEDKQLHNIQFKGTSLASFENDIKNGEDMKVLGLVWNPELDTFKFTVRLNFSPKI